MAKTSSIEKSKQKPKFGVRAHNPVPRLRPAARLSAQIRHVPYLLPRKRASRLYPRYNESFVVDDMLTSEKKITVIVPATAAPRVALAPIDGPEGHR